MQLPLSGLVLDVQLLRGDGEENEEERKGAGPLNPLKVTLGRGVGIATKGRSGIKMATASLTVPL